MFCFAQKIVEALLNPIPIVEYFTRSPHNVSSVTDQFKGKAMA